MKVVYLNFGFSFYRHLDDFREVQHATLLYKSALAQKHDVYYLVRSNLVGNFDYNGIKLQFSSGGIMQFLLLLLKLISRQKPNVVIIHGLIFFPFAPIFLLFPRLKVVFQHHCERFYNKKLSFFMRFFDPFIHGYFFSGTALALPFFDAGCLKMKKVLEVTEGTTDFECKERFADNDKTLVYVGRLIEHKNLITLLKAATLIKRTDYQIHVYYSDNLLEASLKQYCRENKLDDIVIFKGQISHHELQNIFCSSHALISCSLYESSGYAVIEALACGLFPIVSDIPSFRFLMGGLEYSRHFEAKNEKQLAACLEEVLDMKITAEIRSSIRSHFEKRASANAIAKQIDTALKTLIK